MSTLVFATHNAHKLEEVKRLIPDTINLLSLTDINFNEEIEETETTNLEDINKVKHSKLKSDDRLCDIEEIIVKRHTDIENKMTIPANIEIEISSNQDNILRNDNKSENNSNNGEERENNPNYHSLKEYQFMKGRKIKADRQSLLLCACYYDKPDCQLLFSFLS